MTGDQWLLCDEPPNTMSTEQQWIKTSERMPTEADLPIVAFRSLDKISDQIMAFYNFAAFGKDWTHWMKLPSPPKREPTQAEQDKEDFVRWALDKNFGTSYSERMVWNAALAHEREATWAEWTKPSEGGYFYRWFHARCGKGGA